MKLKKLLSVAALLSLAVQSSALRAQTVTGPDSTRVALTSLQSAGSTPWVDISGYAATGHILTVTVDGVMNNLAVSFDCSKDQIAAESIGSLVSAIGGQIAAKRSCTYIRASNTTYDGTATIKFVWHGDVNGSKTAYQPIGGTDSASISRPLLLDTSGAAVTMPISPKGLPLSPCNPLRRDNCKSPQPFN